MQAMIVGLLGAAVLTTACASSTNANHPSATEHEALAANEEIAAKTHLTAVQTSHPLPRASCGGILHAPTGFETCWEDNDRAQTEAATEHRQHAAEHRAASRALRDAEARACVDISDIDRDVSPFAHRKDIISVQQLTDVRAPHTTRLAGASVVFHPVPGLSAEKLQRIVDCHIARNDAMGHVAPDETFCPLVPPNVVAKVTQVPEGLRVDIRTDDDDAAREVIRRARTLTEP